MNSDRRPPRSALSAGRSRAAALFVGLLLVCAGGGSACSSKESAGPKPAVSLGDCAGRAPEPVNAGQSYVSGGGYVFELLELEPAMPVQSDGPPGNHWMVRVTDPSGANVTGGACLTLTSYMPDHGHSGPPAVGVETSEGSGVYDVPDLQLTMPTLFDISFLLSVPAPGSDACGSKDFVAATTETATLRVCLEPASE